MTTAICYGLYDNDNIIGFCGVLHQPHGINKKIKRVTRLVILPDYQGIGLGTQFLNFIAQMYVNKGFDFSIVTSAKNMIMSLKNNKNWIAIRYSTNKCVSPSSTINCNRESMRTKNKTASFMYRSQNNG